MYSIDSISKYIVDIAEFFNHKPIKKEINKINSQKKRQSLVKLNPFIKEYNNIYLPLRDPELFSSDEEFLLKFISSINKTKIIEDIEEKIKKNKDVKLDDFNNSIKEFIQIYHDFIKKKISFKNRIINGEIKFFDECICIKNPIEKNFNLKSNQFLIIKNDIILHSDITNNNPYIKFYFIFKDFLLNDNVFNNNLVDNTILEKFIKDILFRESIDNIYKDIKKSIENKQNSIKNNKKMYHDILESSNYLQCIVNVYTRLPYIKMVISILKLYLKNKENSENEILYIYKLLIKDIKNYEKNLKLPINLYPKEYTLQEVNNLYNSLLLDFRIFTLIYYKVIFNINSKSKIFEEFRILFNYDFIPSIEINKEEIQNNKNNNNE